MKNIGFLGSGFALYGYLKYFSLKNYNLYTLNKYKKIIKKRHDLRKIYKKIVFKKNDNEILKECNEIVFARRPIDQEKFIKKILKKKTYCEKFYFEKPLCINPEKSIFILKELRKEKINFKIGYLFLYTNFFKIFNKIKNKNISIDWKFMSFDLNKNSKSWKLFLSQGGGPLSFYGIHLENYKHYMY